MKKYWPLICLIGIALLASLALHPNNGMAWMHYFMGFFLCQFAMLKLFDVPGFAEGFQKYDLIASHVKPYAYVYPFIELALGLGYLGFFMPIVVYWVTIIVLGVGAIGVIWALVRGLDVRCACMGTSLNVPLSTVTLTEDIAMVIMAIILGLL